ncbi:MAG: hypothetical protein KIT25_03830 [Enhydrobacter sp.]|nr:MAG: hypothetical protein KIT25_03830 [Enhydrobacter sp.]
MVFGFTVAEIILLLVFCLLLLFMPMLLAHGSKQGPAAVGGALKARPENPGSAQSPASRRQQAPPTPAKEPLPEDWKELVPDGAGSEREAGPNGAQESQLRPPTSRPVPGLTVDAVCKKLGIPPNKCTVANADVQLRNAGQHNWPPIIRLKEADGYYFVTGSAQPSPEFTRKVRESVVRQIIEYATQFQTDVIEVVGHTDQQEIRGLSSNLDVTAFDILLKGGPAANMAAADNAGLGFARAAAIVQILGQSDELKKRRMIILPLSAAQVVDTDGKLADGSNSGDVKERRRIEIRLRQSEPGSPR